AEGRYLRRYGQYEQVEDASQPVDILVEPGCILEGQIDGRWADDGAGASGAKQELLVSWCEGGRFQWEGRVRVESGTFELDHVGAGSYSAPLTRGGKRESQPVKFEVAAGFREGERIPLT